MADAMASDSDVLRRAAEKMREQAGKATPSPWVAVGGDIGYDVGHCTCGAGHAPFPHENGCGLAGPLAQTNEADAVYMASMHPVVGLGLAEGLRQHAGEHDSYDCRYWPCALATAARAYLGEGS
jgi:hypothetical protein